MAAHGTAAVNANGTFTYTPIAGYTGTDSFQFKVTDTPAASSSRLVRGEMFATRLSYSSPVTSADGSAVRPSSARRIETCCASFAKNAAVIALTGPGSRRGIVSR